MNLITVSAAGAIVFACYLIAVMFLLRLLAVKLGSHPIGQGLGAIVA